MNSIKGEVDSMADTQQPRPLKRQRIVGDESSFKVVENVPLLGSAHQVLGDPFKIDEPLCPSLRNVVSNDDEAMDPPPPAQETERHPGPTMTGLSVLKLRRIQPGEEVCFGMVGNSNMFGQKGSNFNIGIKYPCPIRGNSVSTKSDNSCSARPIKSTASTGYMPEVWHNTAQIFQDLPCPERHESRIDPIVLYCRDSRQENAGKG